jgi:hypothetical protein
VRLSDSRYGSGATIVKLNNGGDRIFFTDRTGTTHLCGLDRDGNETGCQTLR